VRFLLVVVAALCLAASADAGPGLLVGIDDDTIKWLAKPNGVVGVNRDLGLDALRLTLPWKRGQDKPTRLQGVYLHRVAGAIVLGQRIVLAVYGTPSQVPLTAAQRDQYCGFLVHVVQRIPAIEDVVIWNEVNNPTFWQAGPEAYEALLARCWDRLHAARRNVNVIDSTAPHQDPGAFLLRIGSAYRASGRTRPILDSFGHNVYPESSAEPPSAVHTGSPSIDQGDYARLLDVLAQAFGGTAQPLPGQGRTTVWYLEDGYQSSVPRSLAHVYGGRENERAPVSPEAQAQNLRAAVELAYCQPFVGAFFNFELLDERRLVGWQSGLLYANGVRKPAYEAYKQAIAAVHAGSIDCASLAP
jgi:hypothetical protein